jgi:hypothetical protein
MEPEIEEMKRTTPEAAEARPAIALADAVTAQQSCPTCAAAANSGGKAPSWVYAIGRIEARFPSLAIEKEYAQILGRDQTGGLTDRQALHAVISKSENRYLTRKLCWVMTIEGIETYLLYPRDPGDLTLLIEAIRPNPAPTDLDIVIGTLGPVASPDKCNGLQIPIVAFDQVYSLDRDTLVKAIPKPEKISAEDFAPAAAELFDRIMQMADNAGASDEHRALNYLAVRYPAVYATASDAFARNSSLDSIDVQASPLSGTRKVLEVIFSFRNRTTDVLEKSFTRVDMTDQFPFLVTKMSPYYDK